MSRTPPEILVVGGSLAGLTLALACAGRRLPVRIQERSTEQVQGGDSLSVSLAAIAATTGFDPCVEPRLPVVPAYGDRHLATWPALYGWLRDRVADTPGILLEQGKTVTSVGEAGASVQIGFADGTKALADIVIGADGYHSIVRRTLSPAAPLARYAGYLVWRGLVDEKALERPVPWPANAGLWIQFAHGYRLVAAVLPGRDGSMEAGRRQVTFAWFDVHREALLRRTNCLTADGYIVGTLRKGNIGAEVRAELTALIPTLWPRQWAEAVTIGVQSSDVLSGAPIAEYLPERLAGGSLAIVGDAAHVVSPMTGSGFATGVDDAAVLARVLDESPPDLPVSTALHRYEAARLPYVRALVNHSRQLSADYVRHARTQRRT